MTKPKNQDSVQYHPALVHASGLQAQGDVAKHDIERSPENPAAEQLRWFLRHPKNDQQLAQVLLIGMNPSNACLITRGKTAGGDPTTGAILNNADLIENALKKMCGIDLPVSRIRLAIANLAPFRDPHPVNMNALHSRGQDEDLHQVALPHTEKILGTLIGQSDLIIAMWGSTNGSKNKWKRPLISELWPTISSVITAERPMCAFVNENNKHPDPYHPLHGWWRKGELINVMERPLHTNFHH